MSDEKEFIDNKPTTGHEWDGIKEFDNPLPRWWLWTFYATILWGIAYTIAYPAWPLINGATPGLLEYSSRLDVEADIQKYRDDNAAFACRFGQIKQRLRRQPGVQIHRDSHDWHALYTGFGTRSSGQVVAQPRA